MMPVFLIQRVGNNYASFNTQINKREKFKEANKFLKTKYLRNLF
jgi:hypothetical protein